MDELREVLHELVDAVRHALPPNRVGELHGLVDAAAPAPEPPAVPPVPDGAPPAE